MNNIMEYVVEDIKKFQEGIRTPFGLIRASLYVTEDDNLAQHAMCGFKESFGKTKHPCSICTAPLEDIRRMTEEDDDLLRTPETHEIQVSAIEHAQGQEKERLMTQYGINRRSALNELDGYDVTTGAPPEMIFMIFFLEFFHGLFNIYVKQLS